MAAQNIPRLSRAHDNGFGTHDQIDRLRRADALQDSLHGDGNFAAGKTNITGDKLPRSHKPDVYPTPFFPKLHSPLPALPTHTAGKHLVLLHAVALGVTEAQRADGLGMRSLCGCFVPFDC